MADYVMEAVENWDAAQAAEFGGNVFPDLGHASQMLMGRGYDPVRGKIMYILTDAPIETTTNPTGYTLWDGFDSIAGGASFDNGLYLNLSIAALDTTTKAVTRYDGYTSTSMVPSGIAGSDGTWRRMIGSQAEEEQTPLITDPRTGNVWFHTDADCKIYMTRLEDDYALTISPFVGGASDHFEIFGITDDWVYIGDAGKVGDFYTLELIPRVRTAPETAADYLLSYASFNASWSVSNQIVFGSCLSTDGKLYVLTLDSVPAQWSFQLYEFTPPDSAPFGGPVVGGGWANVTPWGSGTGPNGLSVDTANYFATVEDNTVATPLYLKSEGTVVLLTTYATGDPAEYHLQLSYYKPGGGYTFKGDLVSRYMSASWEIVATAAEAAWEVGHDTGEIISCVRPFDTWRDFNSYDYGDDDSERWFYFSTKPVAGGVTQAAFSGVFVKYRFAEPDDAVVVQVIDSALWNAGQPDYATAIGTDYVVDASQPLITAPIGGSPPAKDVGVSTDGAFWMCGQNANFYQFDSPTYTNRQANDINPPFLWLQYGEPTPPVITYRCMVSTRIGKP